MEPTLWYTIRTAFRTLGLRLYNFFIRPGLLQLGVIECCENSDLEEKAFGLFYYEYKCRNCGNVLRGGSVLYQWWPQLNGLERRIVAPKDRVRVPAVTPGEKVVVKCPYCSSIGFLSPMEQVGEDEYYFNFICKICDRTFFKYIRPGSQDGQGN